MAETQGNPTAVEAGKDEGKKVSPATPVLTLAPDEKKYDMSFLQPQMREVPSMGVTAGTGITAGSVDESSLSDEERQQVEAFVKQIDITDVGVMNSYGASAQKGISTFSASITGTVRAKDFGEIGDSLRELTVAIGSTSEPEKKGLFGLFQKGKQAAKFYIANYQTAETSIKKIERDLQQHQQVLIKDVHILDQMYDMNIQFYKELTMYIIAGKKALDLARQTKLVELKQKADATQDQLDIQIYRDFNDACVRFERRIYDLETTRLVSIQMAPQIRMLQDGDQELINKIHSDIINTIPLWRNQMVLALGIEHTSRALSAQSAVDEMTNEMLRRNAETLKQGAIEAAQASERAIVDIDTMKRVNADIIASITEVVKIHEEGSRKRAQAQEELARIEDELKQALLEAGSK